MSKTIQYGIDSKTGLVWSRVGSEVAIPILDFENMTPENNFKTQYHLEKMNILTVAREANFIKWTKKIPVELKNKHRKFWGFPPLKIK